MTHRHFGQIEGECKCPDDCGCWDDNDPCSWCGGEPDLQECGDPIQCCDPACDGQWHPCSACQGTGLARNQVIW